MPLKIRVSRKFIGGSFLLFLLALISFTVSKLFRDLIYVPMQIIWVTILSAYMFADATKLRLEKDLQNAVILSLIIRVLFALWAVIGSGSLATLLATESDQDRFYNISLQYFNGNFSGYSTKYPYILNFIYNLVGPGQIVPRIINVFFWYIGLKIVSKIYRSSSNQKAKTVMLIYLFLPYGMMLSQELLRESIISLCLIESCYHMLCWMNEGYTKIYEGCHRRRLKSNKNLAIGVLFATVALMFHSGHIAMVISIVVTYALWDGKKCDWKSPVQFIKSGKCIAFMLCVVFAAPLYYFIQNTLYLDGIPSSLSIETIQSFKFLPGRADYLPAGVGIVTSPMEFAFWSFYRMFYFWVSPTPRFWSSVLDIFCFAVDVIPWLYIFYKFIRRMNAKDCMPQSKYIIPVLLFYTFIYGWGTANAGTAMRHRDTLIGIVVMLYFSSYPKKEMFHDKNTSLYRSA